MPDTEKSLGSVGLATLIGKIKSLVASSAIPPDEVTITSNGDTKLSVKDGGIGTQQIADGAVTSSKLADGSVGTSALKDSSVTAAKLADGAVTASKFTGVLPVSKGGTGKTSLSELTSEIGAPVCARVSTGSNTVTVTSPSGTTMSQFSFALVFVSGTTERTYRPSTWIMIPLSEILYSTGYFYGVTVNGGTAVHADVVASISGSKLNMTVSDATIGSSADGVAILVP